MATFSPTAATTDAQILRFATQSADTDREIDRVVRKLTRMRDLARSAAREAGRAQAANGRFQLTGGGLKINGLGKIGPGGFSLTGQFLRGTGGLAIVIGAALAAEQLVQTLDKFQEDEKRLGRPEALARAGGTVLSKAFDLATAGEGGKAIARLVGRFVGGKTAQQVEDSIDSVKRLLFTTPLQKAERALKERMLNVAIEREQSAYENQEFAFINNWRPQNVELRTTEDVEALRKAMWDMNGASVSEDVKRNREELRAKAKAALAED